MSIVKKIQLCNALFFTFLAIQLLVVVLATGWTPIDFLPLIGIGAVLSVFFVILAYYHEKRGVGVLTFILDFVLIALFVFFGILFSGPFDRLFQTFAIIFIGINAIGMVTAVVQWGLQVKTQFLESSTDKTVTSEPKMPKRKISIALFSLLIGSLVFTGLAVFNFNYTYTKQAPEGFTTRSSYWGTPYFMESIQNDSITPSDNENLLVSNASLGSAYPNLRPGTLLYILNVSHAGTPGVNYCDYFKGAQSFPNGTVHLSTPLPDLLGVSIGFVYMTNGKIMEYMQASNSRIITTSWGNYTWIESNNLFHSIPNTYQYLLFEYWNLSYYINIDVHDMGFPHMYNYLPFIERGLDTVNWILGSRPKLAHCVGISYDFEAGNITHWPYSPSRPPLGDIPFESLVSEKGYLQKNEQYDEFTETVKKAYFGLYDSMSVVGLEAYIVYQYWGIQDLSDGDIDFTRLPIWPHPNCEFGMMSYQNGKDAEEALWDIYQTDRNQQAIYGDRGNTILTGWLDHQDPDYLEYYTNDEAGLQRYINDILMHQACGMKEIFHAYSFRMQLKWGDEAFLRVEEALNQAPKKTFTFKAERWDDLDTFLYDAVENFNRLAYALPTILGIIIILILPDPAQKPINTGAKSPIKVENNTRSVNK